MQKIEAAKAFETEYGEPLMIRPEWNSDRVLAKEYYEEKLDLLRTSLSLERHNALNSKLPVGFISFANRESSIE